MYMYTCMCISTVQYVYIHVCVHVHTAVTNLTAITVYSTCININNCTI